MSETEKVYRCVSTAADIAAIENRSKTNAEMVRAAVTAALECAVGNGLITVVPEEDWPRFIVSSPPYQRKDSF